ncbi:MAG: MBL fold metallo-hydrolase [Acidobacteria bacterium]|nr:MAG: MBL fold metallo-hydrolase [Acidobacteriota bacterium]
MPSLTFLGATQTVTGSKYLLEAAGERLMIDCGLFQGAKELRLRNWSPFPVDPGSIHWIVLTHAHLDHTGYLPRLVKEGFHGQVWASSATVDLLRLTLPDSGHLQEEDASYANKKGFSKHKPALPLYTYDEAVKSLELLRAADESKPLELSPRFSVRFIRAGHILGARMVEVTITEAERSLKILFSGDIGRFPQLIIREPANPGTVDYLVCESTYGDRLHPTDDFHTRLAQIVENTVARGGSVIIPAFAIGRTQELLYLFRQLIQQNLMHEVPIHVDSPMAIDATDLYRKHHEDHNVQTDELEAGGHRLFAQPNVHFDRSVDESKALNECHFPTIIISASGMATGGRVLHHLERCLPDHRNTILFVGFQASGTRGQAIQAGAESIKIHGQQIPVRAHIETIENLSGHADYREIIGWLEKFPKAPQKTFVTHGELQAAIALQERMAGALGWHAEVPSYIQKVILD